MKEIASGTRTSIKIIENEEGKAVGFFIGNPGLMPPEVLTEYIRYQLEGVQQRIITMYQGGQRVNIEPACLERLREDYRREDLQEHTVSMLQLSAARSRGLLVMDPDPISS